MKQYTISGGMIEFYAHAVPYLASTRKNKHNLYDCGERVFLALFEQEPVVEENWRGECLRTPRGPDGK